MLTKAQFKNIYLVCRNYDESKKAWELLSNIGHTIGFTYADYPDRWIYALNDSGRVYSTSLNSEKEYLQSYWKDKKRVLFKDLFTSKIPLTEELIKKTAEEFKRLGAINEDTGLNSADLEKEKIEIGHCYDLVDLGVLGDYKGRFFLKKIKVKEKVNEPQKPVKKTVAVEYEDWDAPWDEP